jgi:MFS family permease
MHTAVTPFKRLVTALTISNIGLFIALIPPMVLLITLKIQAIAPQNVAGAMAYVLSIGAFVAMIANPVAGAISDRTRLKFGRRRTWILIGSVFGGGLPYWELDLLKRYGRLSFYGHVHKRSLILFYQQIMLW